MLFLTYGNCVVKIVLLLPLSSLLCIAVTPAVPTKLWLWPAHTMVRILQQHSYTRNKFSWVSTDVRKTCNYIKWFCWSHQYLRILLQSAAHVGLALTSPLVMRESLRVTRRRRGRGRGRSDSSDLGESSHRALASNVMIVSKRTCRCTWLTLHNLWRYVTFSGH